MSYIDVINRVVWGVPALVLIVGVGIYLTIKSRFAQLRLLPEAVKNFFLQFRSSGGGYRELCTALGATVGTGNLAGVAGAIALGGPGAIFWMWICGFLGMATKMAEATLAVRYRQKDISGEYAGGPMYMIRNGLSKRWHLLATVYSLFGVVASFGVGNATQINTVVSGIEAAADALHIHMNMVWRIILGIGIGILILLLLQGGAKRIGETAERLVPVSAAGYILLCILVLVLRIEFLPDAMKSIITGAMNPKAVTGGAIGSAFCALRVGASRGVFTNEAGMGTASIAHAGAQVYHPVTQGLMGIMEVFLDTIVICTMTALVILTSGVPIPYGTDSGIALTSSAFSSVCGEWVTIPIALALCLFALGTILGWGLYGIRCIQYLFGEKSWKGFVWVQVFMAVVGAVAGTGVVWTLSEIVNGLMAIPNLIALAALSPELMRLLDDYKKRSHHA